MVILSDSLLSLDPSHERSSLRDLSGTDQIGYSSIYMTKLANWWMRSMRRSTRYMLSPICIPSGKAPRLGLVAGRGLGAFLVL